MGPFLWEMMKKSLATLPDFLEMIFTSKECFGLNFTELNEGEGESGMAGPVEETAPSSWWSQCHCALPLGHKSRVCNGGVLEHKASPLDCSMGWRAGAHQVTPICCASCLNPHSRVVGAAAHHPATFHRDVGRAEYPEFLELWELSAWLCPC